MEKKNECLIESNKREVIEESHNQVMCGNSLDNSLPLNLESIKNLTPMITNTESFIISKLWDRAVKGDQEEMDKVVLEKFKLNQVDHESALKLLLLKSKTNIAISEDEVSFLNSPSNWTQRGEYFYKINKDTFEKLDIKIENGDRRSGQLQEESLDIWGKEQIEALVNFEGDKNLGLRTFLFCRKNRDYPCLMLMKDQNNEWVKSSEGAIWSQPKLARSESNGSYLEKRGNTPQGVFKINAVMPQTDKKIVYGSERRIILDFLEDNEYLDNQSSYIPTELQNKEAWAEVSKAKSLGRDLFRIHGVGTQNIIPQTKFYPFIPTAGCITSREGEYGGITYNDQRQMLNKMMESLGLEPNEENEVYINGYLYIIDIDNQDKAVTLEDIL